MKVILNDINEEEHPFPVVHFVCGNCGTEFISDQYTPSQGTDEETTDYYVDECPKCLTICSVPVIPPDESLEPGSPGDSD